MTDKLLLGLWKGNRIMSAFEPHRADDLRVHVYAVCWNEEQILPFFLRYYSAFAERIVVYDNESTDASPEIIRRWPGAELRRFSTNGVFDDRANLQIKNTSYRDSLGLADFVIVVDIDEIVYHPQIAEVLMQYKRQGVTLPRTRGFDMVSWRFPRAQGQIVDLVNLGCASNEYSKRCVFDPSIGINFELGCNTCKPEGPVVENTGAELSLLHYHYLGLLRCILRHRRVRDRLAAAAFQTKTGYQFRWGPAKIAGRFANYRVNANDVINNRRSLLSLSFGPVLNLAKGFYWKHKKRW